MKSELSRERALSGSFFVQGLHCGLCAELVVCDCGSAMRAERGGWIDGAAAGRAVRVCWGCYMARDEGAEDLIGDVGCLGGVVLADAGWHEKALDDTQDCGDAGPKENKVDDTRCVSAEIEVVDPECAKEDCEQDASHLVFAGAFVLGEEPGSLLVGHSDGVGRIGVLHDLLLL